MTPVVSSFPSSAWKITTQLTTHFRRTHAEHDQTTRSRHLWGKIWSHLGDQRVTWKKLVRHINIKTIKKRLLYAWIKDRFVPTRAEIWMKTHWVYFIRSYPNILSVLSCVRLDIAWTKCWRKDAENDEFQNWYTSTVHCQSGNGIFQKERVL